MREEFSYNIILLGGTGAKCGEILLHMCANGYFRYRYLNILYIDSDLKNGNAEKFKNLYDTYAKCRKQYVIEGSPIDCFFYTEVRLMIKNPVQNYHKFKELADGTGHDHGSMVAARALMETLYSNEEMGLNISDGFFAHPNVGAAMFAANMNKIMEDFQEMIKLDLSETKMVKLFLLGSIFGGTGASSLPTIAKHLRKVLFGKSKNKNIQKQMKIGGCIVLPYFLFSHEGSRMEEADDGTAAIEADKFALKTTSALEYYRYVDKDEGRKTFDELYLLGHDAADVRGHYATAGSKQRNLPHIVELYAAMSAVTFFDNNMEVSGHYFAVVPKKTIGGENIYAAEKGYGHFFVMMRFAFVMNSLILEELFDYTQKEKLRPTAKRIPWYYDFLNGKAQGKDFDGGRLHNLFRAISDYCNEYIRWFAELNLDNIDKTDMRDIDYNEDKGDIVNYLSFFSKELLFRQHQNDQIKNGFITSDDDEIRNMYNENLKYIRKNFPKLEEIHFNTDFRSEKVTMDKIWKRLSNMGFGSFVKDDDAFKNINRSNDKSMESGVRNLINAVFCACLF